MKIFKRIFPLFSFFVPYVAFALTKTSTFRDILDIFLNLGLRTIPFLAILALLIFALGIGRFIRDTSSGKEVDKGILVWGVVALFVLFTIWGIIAFLRSEFGFGSDVGIPQIHL